MYFNRRKTRSIILTSLAVGLVQLFYFLYLGRLRLVAPDEGFYLLASSLVMQGSMLYVDFFYPQMPLVPYFYGFWMEIFGHDWYSARAFSALLTALTGTLLFSLCYKKWGISYAVAGVVLFCTSNFVFPWYLTVQTYSLSTLFLFLAYLALAWPAEKLNPESARGRYFLAGLGLGFAVGSRLFFAGVFPLFVIHALFRSFSFRERINSCLFLGLGSLVALLPVLYYLLIDADIFYFNNLGYHLLRSDQTFEDALQHKQRMALVLFGFINGRQFEGQGISILLYLSIAYFFIMTLRGKRADMSFYLAAGLFVLNFLPTPPYHQYFSTLIPFLIVGALLCIREMFKVALSLRSKRAAGVSVAFVSFVSFFLGFHYLKDLPVDIKNFSSTGYGVTGMGRSRQPENWNLESMTAISSAVNKHTEKGDRVISHWPGYLFSSHAKPFPGLENHFGIRVVGQLEEKRRQRYRLISSQEIAAAVREGSVDAVIMNDFPRRRGLQNALEEGGYEEVERVEDVRIFLRSSFSPTTSEEESQH